MIISTYLGILIPSIPKTLTELVVKITIEILVSTTWNLI